MPRKKKNDLNFDLYRDPNKIRDPLDQMLHFATQQTCKPKKMAVSWSNGYTMCFVDGKDTDLMLEMVTFLTACRHIPEMVNTIRKLRSALDDALAGVDSGNVDVGAINDALLAGNEVLYKLRMHWQESVTRSQNTKQIAEKKIERIRQPYGRAEKLKH